MREHTNWLPMTGQKRMPVVDGQSILKTLALMTVAALIGLAYVVLLPLVGVCMLFAVLGMGLATKFGWVRK